MKINEAQTVTAVGAGGSTGSNTAATGQPSRATIVTTNQLSSLKITVENGMNMAAIERGTRLRELVQQVRTGAYQPNPSALADQILAEAELDARLSRSLN